MIQRGYDCQHHSDPRSGCYTVDWVSRKDYETLIIRMLHIPHKSGHSPPETLPHPSRGTYISRLPVKSDSTRQKYKLTPKQEASANKSTSPTSSSSDHRNLDDIVTDDTETSDPQRSYNRRPTSRSARTPSALQDYSPRSTKPKGLAIRHGTIDSLTQNRIGNETRDDLEANFRPTRALKEDLHLDRDGSHLQAKSANVFGGPEPGSLGANPEVSIAVAPAHQLSPDTMPYYQNNVAPGRIIPELRSLMSTTTSDYIPPTTPNLLSASTPSTRYSESPGVWSSRNTTPGSLSSYSPGLVQPISPKDVFRSPNSGRRNSMGRQDQNTAGNEASTQSNSGVWRNAMGLNSPPQSMPSRSTEVERLHFKKKRDHKVETLPPAPPPRKSSTNFRSPDKQPKTPRKRSKSTRSNSTSSTVEPHNDLTTDIKEPKSQQRWDRHVQRKPERPSREGAIFTSDETSSNLLPPSVDTVPSINNNEEFSGFQGLSGREKKLPAIPSTIDPNPTQSIGNSTTVVAGPRETALPEHPPMTAQQYCKHESELEHSQPVEADKKPSRFGFLGRKMKSTKHEDPSVKPSKTLRKGPASGTGHEGYGKWGFSRGRRLSNTGMQGPRGISTSASDSASRSVTSLRSHTSSGQESDMDEFLSQRLEPIIIRGGGGPLGSHPNLSNDSQSQISESGVQGGRIAQQLSSTSPISGSVSPPIAVAHSPTSPDELSQSIQPIISNESYLATTSEAKGSVQLHQSSDDGPKPKASLWNIFSKNRKPTQKFTGVNVPTKKPVAIAPLHDTKPLAFYAMDDLESDFEDFESLDGSELPERRISQRAKIPEPSSLRTPHHTLRRQQGYSVLLPSPPIRSSDFTYSRRSPSPRVVFNHDDAREVNIESMLGDLEREQAVMQVGRGRLELEDADQQRASVVRSFSRPFGPESLPPKTEVSSSVYPLMAIDDPFKISTTDAFPFGRSHTAPPKSARREEGDKYIDMWDPSTGRDLIDYSPKTASEIPPPLTPKGHFGNTPAPHIRQDEVWKEYDDLIDHALSPISGSKALESQFTQTSRPTISVLAPRISQNDATPVWPTQITQGAFEGRTSAEHDSILALYAQTSEPFLSNSPLQSPSTLLPPLTSHKSSESVRLRRSRIISALHSSMTPSELTSDRGSMGIEESARDSNASLRHPRNSALQEEDDTSILDLDNIPEESNTHPHHVNTVLLDIAERNRDGPIALSNLRYVALMTSRWLSFGRVLFSPAHDKLQSSSNDRLLIIDGLGNDDWSFYCALTYPNATIFNLSGRDPFSDSGRRSGGWKAPINHRNVSHVRLEEPFPFPGSFFTVVVFRYPIATSEQTLKRTIAECKRVLQPGGYLELSVIDLDMVNMGNRTRRAIRMLKTRMNVAEPDICLKPAVDNIQRLIGRRGFENLNRCVVNLPVAGAIGSLGSESSRASNGSSGSHFSNASTSAASPNPSRNAKGINRARMSDQNFSLSDLIADHSSAGDEKLADVVAKVGRYFFSRCYEWAVLPDGNMERSIWSERAVLRECERRVTGFKLMIAYAQKPAENRRRTLSEPTKPTPAVVGTTMMKEYDRVMRR